MLPLHGKFFLEKSPHTLEWSTMHTDYSVTIVHNSKKMSKN